MSADENLGPQFTMRYTAYGPEGYVEKERTVTGPAYHGGRARLGPGGMLTAGRKTNPWGDEGPKSSHVHFTTNLATAAQYARDTRGHVYEVRPTGDVKPGYNADEFKSAHPLEVTRKVPRAEWPR